MVITITGATGFVGVNLVPFLSKDLEVNTLSLRSEDWCEKYRNNTEVLIHLAGMAHDTSNTIDDSEYFKVNCDLTKDLFDLFLQSNAKDFFYFSSVKAVADSVEGVLREDFIPNPLTPYGKSKHQAEKYMLNFQLPKGKRLFIIRPCMIHGPGNKGNLNLLYTIVKKGFPWPLAAFNNKRSFLSIDNLCYLVKEMIKNRELESGVYNFADDKPVSTNELIKLIAQSVGKKPRLWYLNKNMMESISKLGDRIKLPLNSERLKKLTENYEVDNSKIKDALSIEYLPCSATLGLLKTFESFDALN